MIKAIIQKLANLWNIAKIENKEALKPYYDEIVDLLRKEDEDSSKSKTEKLQKYTSLANKLIATYKSIIPEKSKNGYAWVCSTAVASQRLASPKVSDIESYTEDEVVLACKMYLRDKYTNASTKDRIYCVVLPYFIWKEDNGFKSPMLDYLAKIRENKDNGREEDFSGSDTSDLSWMYSIK